MQFYLPEEWANDLPRRKKVGVPESTTFRKKWENTLEQIDNAIAWGVRKRLVLADAGVTATSASSAPDSRSAGSTTSSACRVRHGLAARRGA